MLFGEQRRKQAIARADQAVREAREWWGFAQLVPMSQWPRGIVLRRGEPIYFESSARLFEPQRQPGQWRSTSSGMSYRITRGISYRTGKSRGAYIPGEVKQTATDVGTVVITDRRVIFYGSKRTSEWAFSKMVAHDVTSLWGALFFSVSNRQKTAGVFVGEDKAVAAASIVEAATERFQGQAQYDRYIKSVEAEWQKHYDEWVRLSTPGTPLQSPVRAAAPRQQMRFAGRPRKPIRPEFIVGPIAAVFFVFVVIVGNLAGGSEATPTSTTAPVPTSSRSFDVTFPEGWQYRVEVVLPAPAVQAHYEIENSPPGRAEILVEFERIKVTAVGTIEGRNAPDRWWKTSMIWNKPTGIELDAPTDCDRAEAADTQFECQRGSHYHGPETDETAATNTVAFFTEHPNPDMVRLYGGDYWGGCDFLVPFDPAQPVLPDTSSDTYDPTGEHCRLTLG